MSGAGIGVVPMFALTDPLESAVVRAVLEDFEPRALPMHIVYASTPLGYSSPLFRLLSMPPTQLETVPPEHPPARPESHLFLGIVVGLVAASIGALYTVVARLGIANGLASSDLTFLRFFVAGLVTFPVLAWHWRRDPVALISRWRVWLSISLMAGPLFGLLMFSAFQLAPPSHAAVFPFSTISVMGTIMAALFLGDRITPRKALGIAIVLCGLFVLSGLQLSSLTRQSLTGDALFVAAGILWAGFGIVLRRYRLEPMLATAVISLFAVVTYVPIYLIAIGTHRLLQASFDAVMLQVLVQGLLAGAGSLYTYAKMASLLGAARAAVFPAIAPGLASLMAWPILGHVPDFAEALGLGLSISGLLITVTGANRRSGQTAAEAGRKPARVKTT